MHVQILKKIKLSYQSYDHWYFFLVLPLVFFFGIVLRPLLPKYATHTWSLYQKTNHNNLNKYMYKF